MKKSPRTHAVAVGALLVLATLNVFVLQRERLRKTGAMMFVALDVRDPRSLFQGDYMALRYAVPEPFATDTTLAPEGRFVVRLDARGVAEIDRLYHPGERLGEDERLLRYRRRGSEILLGPRAFFFQEGRGAEYAAARFGAFRVAADGDALLVGLRDAELNPLGPPEKGGGGLTFVRVNGLVGSPPPPRRLFRTSPGLPRIRLRLPERPPPTASWPGSSTSPSSTIARSSRG